MIEFDDFLEEKLQDEEIKKNMRQFSQSWMLYVRWLRQDFLKSLFKNRLAERTVHNKTDVLLIITLLFSKFVLTASYDLI